MQNVTVTIDPQTGDVTIEVDGVAGKSCEDLTRDLERALGKVAERKRKPDYYKSEARRGLHLFE